MKSAILSLCITAGLAGALFLRPAQQSGKPKPAAASNAVEATDFRTILSALPAAAPSAAGQCRTAARQAAEAAPNDWKAWAALGDALTQEHRDSLDPALIDHAEAAYTRAFTLNRKALDCLTGLAWVFGARHDFAASIEWAKLALAADDKSPAALGIMGDAHFELGSYDEAGDCYQRMMDARPDLSSWSRGAQFLWTTGHKAKARWLMEKAVRAGGPFVENTGWCRSRLAMMRFHDGDLTGAMQVLDESLNAGTRDAHVLLAAGRIAAAAGNAETAQRAWNRLLEAGPHPEALAGMGDLAAVRGDHADAAAWYSKVDAFHTAHKDKGRHYHLQYARFLADHDRDLETARTLAEEAKFSRNVFDLDTVAWVRFKTGDIPGAVQCMKQALRCNTPDASFSYHAGVIAAAAGDKAAARRRLSEALSMNPSFDPLHAAFARSALEVLLPGESMAAAATDSGNRSDAGGTQ